MNRFLALTALVFCFSASAQTIQWEKSYGGLFNETVFSVLNTTDGGYLVGSFTESNNGDVDGNHGGSDFWLLKLNSSGEKQWQKCIGGTSSDVVTSMANAASGGYILAGNTASNGLKNDSQVYGNRGDFDVWVVKVDEEGEIEWRQCYGGCFREDARSVRQLKDGSYCLVGGTLSYNSGEVFGSHGDWDAWVLKIAPNGELLWQKTIGGSGIDYLYDVAETHDGNLVVSGLSSSVNDDLSGSVNKGYEDVWIAKISAAGNLLWNKTYGGSAYDGARGMCLANDGSIVLTGITYSYDGDVSGFIGANDTWVLHLDDSGNLLWEKTFGGTSPDVGYCVFQRTDGNFIVVGETSSSDWDVIGNHGGRDVWMLIVDNNGNLKGQNCFGGSNNDFARNAYPGVGDSFVIGGTSSSFDGDVTENFGSSDSWIFKISVPLGLKPVAPAAQVYQLTVMPNPSSEMVLVTCDVPGEKQMAIFDEAGKQVQTIDMDTNPKALQITHLPAGAYVVRVSTINGLVLNTQFVKN